MRVFPPFLVVAIIVLSWDGAVALTDDVVATGEVIAIADIVRLPHPAAASRPPAVIRGQVIVHRAEGGAPGIVVEDSTGGVLVVGLDDALASGGPGPWSPVVGDAVEVRGHVEPGAPQPVVRAERIETFGPRPLPEPRVCDVEAFLDGYEECRLVAVEGIVQQAWRAGGGITLEIEAAGGLFLADLGPEASSSETIREPQVLVDAVVRVGGPASSLLNRRGEVVRPRIAVERDAWCRVVRPPPRPLPKPVPLDTISSPGATATRGHRVRTFGTVVHAVTGRVLHLQNGPAGVMVYLGTGDVGSDERFVPGDLVEVMGFVDRSGRVAAIRGAAALRTGKKPPPEPLIVTPRAILDASGPGLGGGVSGDYDGCLVRFGGLLLQAQTTDDGAVFVLRSDGVIVAVESDRATTDTLPVLETGSFLTVTGVAVVDRTTGADALGGAPGERVRLLLRDATDLVVAERPSWWTAARLAAGSGILGVILAAALAWVALLRRQVRVQRRRLAAEMRSRRDAALEFEATLRERNRLAANLHDTLQQTITGIGFQLDACAALGNEGRDVRPPLAVARRMVAHAAGELQGSVWTMRSLPLDGLRFGAALERLVGRLGEGRATRISMAATPSADDLPEFVAGSILLIVQEAVHNALRHADAATIDITVDDEPARDRVRVRIVDDGRGFTAGAQAGPGEGHFGIHGIRERAERLGGSATIVSRPGAGAVVEVFVGRRDYDAEIDVLPARQTSGTPG